MIRIVLGSLLLAGVFALITAAMVHAFGWRVTAVTWATSLSFTATIVVAAWLIAGGSA